MTSCYLTYLRAISYELRAYLRVTFDIVTCDMILVTCDLKLISTEDKMRILVVEDEPAAADHISKTMTETERYDAIVAHNGIEAFELLDSNKRFLGFAENRIKCIILDLKMPEMDGLQFLKKMRKEEAFYKVMPVIILTAYEDEEKLAVTASPSSGLAAAYLKKPFTREALIEAVDRVLGGEMAYMIDQTRERKNQRMKELSEERKNPKS